MRLNLCVAAWVVVALCSACRSRALPAPDGSTGNTAGAAGAGTGIQDAQGGGGTGGAAGGDAGLGGAVAGDAGLGGAGGVAGTAGGAGFAGATTGGAGLGGSAGGAAGAAGAPASIPDCPPSTGTGQPCVAPSACNNVVCHACSDQYWNIARGTCGCLSTGVWNCPFPPHPIGDCFFDPPLDCDIAQFLYVDATCQTHPPCETSTPP